MCAALLPAADLFAQEAAPESADRRGDKDALKAERGRIKARTEAAKQEQTALKNQIREALRSGDAQTAESLQAELKTMREKNIQARQAAVENLKSARQKLKSDKKAARTERMDRNEDGTVGQAERAKFRQERRKADNDNNPPGPQGGAGTNWENPPGPQGGPGAGPNKGNPGARDHGQGGEKRIGPQGKNKP